MLIKRLIITIIIAAVCIGAYFGFRYYYNNLEYLDFKVLSVIEEENSRDDSKYYEFGSGLLRCSNEGVSYIKNEETVWNQPFELKNILLDFCGDFVAIGSENSNEIYLCSPEGFISKIDTAYPIKSLEVSKNGVVGVVLKQGDSSYIEILDQDSSKIVSIKTVLESNGQPLDMSMSDDAKEMVVSYVFFDSGIVSTKVVFYDFSDAKSSEEEKIAGGFNQYKSAIVPRVEFLDNNTVCAFGDDMYTIYSAGSKPDIKIEHSIDKEIKSIFYDDDYFGFVLKNNDSDNPFLVEIYNKNGKLKSTFEFDFAYTDIALSGKNLLMYNDNSIEIRNFEGVKKFKYTFDEEINCVIGTGLNKYIIAMKNSVKEIRLKQ